MTRPQAKPASSHLWKSVEVRIFRPVHYHRFRTRYTVAMNDLNTYKECKACGQCCTLTLIAMTTQEAQDILDYVQENDIHPKDQGPNICPFRGDDMKCMIYPVRSQTCRLYGCTKSRFRMIDENPDLVIPDDKVFVDMRRVFLEGDYSIKDQPVVPRTSIGPAKLAEAAKTADPTEPAKSPEPKAQ